MPYLLNRNIIYVDAVINVEGSTTQGLKLICIPKNVARQKSDLIKRIEEEMRLLQEKHQSGFYNGHIFAQVERSTKWEKYLEDYERIVTPLVQQYHRLTPSGTKSLKKVVSRPLEKYQQGDEYKGFV